MPNAIFYTVELCNPDVPGNWYHALDGAGQVAQYPTVQEAHASRPYPDPCLYRILGPFDGATGLPCHPPVLIRMPKETVESGGPGCPPDPLEQGTSLGIIQEDGITIGTGTFVGRATMESCQAYVDQKKGPGYRVRCYHPDWRGTASRGALATVILVTKASGVELLGAAMKKAAAEGRIKDDNPQGIKTLLEAVVGQPMHLLQDCHDEPCSCDKSDHVLTGDGANHF